MQSQTNHSTLSSIAGHTGIYCDCILHCLEFEIIWQTAIHSSATVAFGISHT